MILPKFLAFFKRLDTKISMVIAVHFTLIVGILLYGLLHGYKISAKRTEEYSKLLSVAIINQHQGLARDAEVILKSWAGSLEEKSSLPDSTACKEPIINLVADHQEKYLIYGVINDSYEIICAQDPFTQGTNVEHRKYIRDAFQYNKLTVSGYQIGVVTGNPSINFGYPVINDAGEVTHVLILALGLDLTRDSLASMSLPDSSEIMVVDSTGLIIMDYPGDTDRIGELAFNKAAFQRLLEEKGGNFEAKGMDSLRRSYTVEPVYIDGEDGPDAFIVVGLPKSLLLKDVDKLRDNIVTLILFTFLIEFIIVALFSANTPDKKISVK